MGKERLTALPQEVQETILGILKILILNTEQTGISTKTMGRLLLLFTIRI